MHALVFYLSRQQWLSLHYDFTSKSYISKKICQLIDYPWSSELDNDISELISLDYLKVKPGNLTLRWNPARDTEANRLVEKLDPFDISAEPISNALRDRQPLVRQSYKLYLAGKMK